MRLGVLDVGSNTVHMLIMDATRNSRPRPSGKERSTIRLMDYLDDDGNINSEGQDLLEAAVRRGISAARDAEVDEVIGMCTSAVREATNGTEVLEHLEQAAGIRFTVLTGNQEAELTYLAARRWHGWGSGQLLLLDIGGGSLEIAAGIDEIPDFTLSAPLGAGRLTKAYLHSDPPKKSELSDLKDHIKDQLKPVVKQLKEMPKPDHVVATSKTFRSLARLGGQRHSVVGPEERRRMSLDDLQDWVPRLGRLPAAQRMELPGITAERTYQIVAGAMVAEQTMKKLKVNRIEICPWALREGIILNRLEQLPVHHNFPLHRSA